MNDRYFKAIYHVQINDKGDTEQKYVYGHFDYDNDVWAFKDYDGSTLVNLCFEDGPYYNKLDAIIDIYQGEEYCEEITKEEYENPKN